MSKRYAWMYTKPGLVSACGFTNKRAFQREIKKLENDPYITSAIPEFWEYKYSSHLTPKIWLFILDQLGPQNPEKEFQNIKRDFELDDENDKEELDILRTILNRKLDLPHMKFKNNFGLTNPFS